MTAVYHKIRKYLIGAPGVKTFWTGEHQKEKLGMQGYILNNRLQHVAGLDENSYKHITFMNADFCGEIPANFEDVIRALPGLIVFGVTRSRRLTTEFPDYSWWGKEIRVFVQAKVICKFYRRHRC